MKTLTIIALALISLSLFAETCESIDQQIESILSKSKISTVSAEDLGWHSYIDQRKIDAELMPLVFISCDSGRPVEDTYSCSGIFRFTQCSVLCRND